MNLRTRGVALGAVLVGVLAGPAVTGAVAKKPSTKRAALTRAEKRELKAIKAIEALRADSTSASTDPPRAPGWQFRT